MNRAPATTRTPQDVLAILATACFLADIGLSQWGRMPACEKLRFGRQHGLTPADLIAAVQHLGDWMTAQAVAALEREARHG